MLVVNCIVNEHNPWLVVLAGLICVLGVWITLRLVARAQQREGRQRYGWIFLASVAGGSSIWCTHFIAMLAYDAPTAVSFEPMLTMISLLAAIIGAAAGIHCALAYRRAPEIGGAIVGIGIASMHYLGMRAFAVDGVVVWDTSYVAASWAISLGLSALAIGQFVRRAYRHSDVVGLALLTLAVIGLHFTGMASMVVIPQTLGGITDPAVLIAMAVAVAGGAIVIGSTGLVSHLIDNEVTRENIEQLKYLAHNDGLTHLPNRRAFTDHLTAELRAAGAQGWQVAVIGLDLNRFKEINDQRGHRAGDQVLQIIGFRFNQLCREGEYIARIGGDEFSAVKRLTAGDSLLDFLDRIEMSVGQPISIDGISVTVGASVGIAVYPQDGDSVETLINNADLAMYRAKSEIVQERCFYDQEMDESARRRRNLSQDLRDAVAQGQLHLHYQVQNNIASGAIVGYEALLRWNHPIHGLVPPNEFIPLAEQSGLIVEVGEWVLRTACREAASWPEPFKIAINISPVQFVNADLAALVHTILLETGLKASRLELEITESTIIADKALALRTLRAIRALGVTIAIDDFGTGYSSLDTLRSFPFDRIKLDRSFMNEAERSPEARAIIRAMLALGKSLRVPVLAEGVESVAHLELLRADGCDEAQGFYLGRPKPISEISHAEMPAYTPVVLKRAS